MCDEVNLTYFEQHFLSLLGVRKVLEVGSYNVNGNCKQLLLSRGLDYLGIDIREGPDVDVVCDITADLSDVERALPTAPFDLILCMNVLEHLFEPVRALDNMVALLGSRGHLVIVTPTVWDLHDWPHDFCRLNPDFFRHYAKRSGLQILPGTLVFSARDTGKFYENVNVLPMVAPEMHGSLAARGALRLLGLFMPEIRQCWTRIYLNLIYQKQ